MAGPTYPRHHGSRRDRGRSRRDRSRDGSVDMSPYNSDEPRGRSSRRPTYNDGDGSAEYFYDDDDDDDDDDDGYRYPPRSSDHRSRRRQGRGGRGRTPPARGRSSHDGRRGRDDSVDDNNNNNNNKKKRSQMIKAGLSAAAVEAFRQKNRPGDWVGAKGVRVATAAISAAVIDAGMDRNPGRGAVGNILKSTIGGLVFDKIANGGRR